jgi:hypothetical protein
MLPFYSLFFIPVTTRLEKMSKDNINSKHDL